MVWLPMDRADVLYVATPLAFSVPVPRTVAPSLNVTVPVGMPLAPVTVAVSVTCWPTAVEAFDVPSDVLLAVAPVTGPTDVARTQLRLQTKPLLELASKATFSTCVPAERLTLVLVTVAQVFQPPVLGI